MTTPGVPGLVLGEPGSAGSAGSFPLSCIMPKAPCLYSTAPGAREVQSILTPSSMFGPKRTFVHCAANDYYEPILSNAAHIVNLWSRTKAVATFEYLVTAPKHQITTAFDVFALR